MDLCERVSRYPLPEQLLADYRGECLGRSICLLTNLDRSPLLREDPNGAAALAYVKAHRQRAAPPAPQ